ncbi:hypothetical protein LCGC14_3125970 [marine sediment metagenome]|uniref:Nudix hydrolase domain-containing protein n=1 Tax=marine sediment metagenome TaxID=412755 RepID=A0A0F8W126_9ZZZZ
METKKYEVIKSNEIWRGHIFSIRVDDVRMPLGNIAQREVISHPGAVGVVPVTKEDEVVLVRQYRHPVGAYLLEIPAGKLDKDQESPDDCARRELKEEAGVEFKDLIELIKFHNSPGHSNELFHLYMAQVESIGEMSPEGDEEQDMERVIIPITVALQMIDDRQIVDAKSIIGLLMAARRLGIPS